MSDHEALSTPPSQHPRLTKIVDGITFVLFIGALVTPYPPILIAAAAWTFLVLALPLLFRGAFTLAIPRHANLNGEPPRQLIALSMMSMALGITGVIGAFRMPLVYALGDASIFGSALFLAALAADPQLRTPTQATLLLAQCAFWTLGARVAIVGFLNV